MEKLSWLAPCDQENFVIKYGPRQFMNNECHLRLAQRNILIKKYAVQGVNLKQLDRIEHEAMICCLRFVITQDRTRWLLP